MLLWMLVCQLVLYCRLESTVCSPFVPMDYHIFMLLLGHLNERTIRNLYDNLRQIILCQSNSVHASLNICNTIKQKLFLYVVLKKALFWDSTSINTAYQATPSEEIKLLKGLQANRTYLRNGLLAIMKASCTWCVHIIQWIQACFPALWLKH